MKKIILFTCILSPSVLATTESDPSHFFVGLKGGYQWALDDNYKHSNPKGTIFGVYTGLQFSPSYSWDVGYQYHDELKADVTSVNVKTWLIESALRYDWYLQDNLSLYGRLGVTYWDIEKTQLSSDKLNAKGGSPLGELGVNYNFTPNLRLSAGYQYIDSIGKSNTGKYDSHAALASLTYLFDNATQPELGKATSVPDVKDIPIIATEVISVEPSPQTLTFTSKTITALFDFDSLKEINHDFIEQLTEIAAVLNTYPQSRVVIVGHTDSVGSEVYNKELSKRRALAVAGQLLTLGVKSNQIGVQGKGASHPVGDDRTTTGQAQNRRVEVTIPNFQYQK